ncbi:MAG: type II secretion system F family protein [Nitrospirae bacterium]|nr:type II secretion system F family protein [Nitrospirota bacterium]
MPIFEYKGYRVDGTEAVGTIEADGLRDAVSKIKESGLLPKEVNEYVRREKGVFFKKRDAALLPAITRQLSILLFSGVPLTEAFRSLSEENKGYWKETLIKIREGIEGGSSLSRAMAEYKDIFPEFYINMVAAGEASGNLGSVLSRLSDFLERQDAVRHKVRAAMIYPIFMVCVGFIVLSFLFTLVVPKIVKIFEDTRSSLPFITIVLIAISNFFRDYWWVIAAVIAGSIIWFKRFRQKNELLIDNILMKMPGNIIQSLYFSRFTRTFGFLLEGGLPILRALELSSVAIGNKMLQAKIKDAGRKVAEGAKLSASLEGFPPVLLQLISTGEKGGRLVEVLNKAADSYEEDFSRRVQRALSLLEPSMILLMGLIVGVIVFAVLLPIFQLNQIIR